MTEDQVYQMAKKYYDEGLWTKDMVKALVAKGKLTAEHYKDITGEEYDSGTTTSGGGTTA